MSVLPERMRLAGDRHRPHYHFSPPANWLNDPNGLIQWNGTFHLFYQYNPNGAFHGTIHWGHASAHDLVHWRDHAVALTPTPDSPDAEGCWSGCAVDYNGSPVFVYTGVHPQTVCLAISADDLESWQKFPGNPVIDAPPAEIAAQSGGDFRDPYVWFEDDSWWMVIGARREGAGGMILLYRSPDLIQWEYVRVLLAGDEEHGRYFFEGAMWECPNLLRFGDRSALILSVQDAERRLRYAAYFAGRNQDRELLPDVGSILAFGHSFYAPQATRLDDGRTVLFGWLRELRPLQDSIDAGWNGCMSLPLIASMLPDGRVSLTPAAEVASLREDGQAVGNLLLAPHEVGRLDTTGDALEVLFEFDTNSSADFGLAVRCLPGDADSMRAIVSPGKGEVLFSYGTHADSALPTETARLARLPEETLEVRIFIDGSILELFAPGVYLATRIYPAPDGEIEISVYALDAPVHVGRISTWRLASTW